MSEVGWGCTGPLRQQLKGVVTTEREREREDSSDQELLVSITLLSTEDKARVFLFYAPVQLTTCSVPVPKHGCSCLAITFFFLPVTVIFIEPLWLSVIFVVVMKTLPK